MANESLTFSIGADTKSFTDGIGGAIAAIGGLVAAFVGAQAVIQAFSEAINLGGRLNDLSTRTGETAGNLAILERAFENTSVGAEKVGPALNKMQIAIANAAEGSEKATRALQELGLSFLDLQGKTPLEQFETIGRALSGIRDPAERAQIAFEIFGRTGTELLPILRNVGVELDLARSQLGSLPSILDKSSASFDAIGDSLNAIRQKSTELAVGFLSTLAPAIEKVLNSLSTLDAAGFGQGLSEFLLGAFSQPLKLIELWGVTMRYVSQLFVNEMISGIDYISRLLGMSLTEVLGSVFGGMAKYVEPLWEIAKLLNPTLGALQFGVNNVMATVDEVKEKIANAFTKAVGDTDYIRRDYLDAASSAENIKNLTTEIREDGRQFAQYLAGATVPTMLTTPLGQSGTELLDAVIAEDKRLAEAYQLRSTPMGGTGTELLDAVIAEEKRNTARTGVTPVQTAAQVQAAFNAQLALISAANPNQAIGQSRSAQKVIDLQKEMETLQALGRGGTAEASAIQRSIDANTAIALGASLTADELDVARDQAMADYWRDPTQKFSDLEDKYRADLLADKLKTDPELAQREKAAEAIKQKEAEKPVSMQSIVNSVLMILQKIEPKIPQHVMR